MQSCWKAGTGWSCLHSCHCKITHSRRGCVTTTNSNQCVYFTAKEWEDKREEILLVISSCTLSHISKYLDRISSLLWNPHKSVIRRRPGKLHAHHQMAKRCSNSRRDGGQETLFLVSSGARRAKGGNKLNYATIGERAGTIIVRDSKMS